MLGTLRPRPTVGQAFLGLTFHKISRGVRNAGEPCEGALEDSQRSKTAYSECGDLRGWGSASVWHAWLLFTTRGQVETALSVCGELERVARDAGDPLLRAWGLITRGVVERGSGCEDDAGAHLRESLPLFAAVPDYAGYLSASSDLALILLGKGEVAEATSWIEAGEALISDRGMRGYPVAANRNARAELLLQEASTTAGAETLDRAAHACRAALRTSGTFRGRMPHALRLSAWHHWLRGRHAAAHRDWIRSIDVSRELGAKFEAAVTERERARLTGDAGAAGPTSLPPRSS